MNKVILFSEYFPPAFLAGGPPKSAMNLVNQLDGEIIFEVYTSDYDLKNTKKLNVKKNKFIKYLNGSAVIYNSSIGYFINFFKLELNNASSFYLNTFFSIKWNLIPCIIGFFLNKKIIISPRGQFHLSSLKQKKLKKKIYLFFFKLLIYKKNIIFHVTDNDEYIQIKKTFFDPKIKKISNFINFYKNSPINKNKDFFFIGRINKKKNILFFLTSLLQSKIENFKMDIYGPIEDTNYWKKCLNVMKELNHKNSVHYCGVINTTKNDKILSKYNFFILPSLSENFSITTCEALNNRCIPIITKNSPWKFIEKKKCGFRFNPKSRMEIISIIYKVMKFDKIKKSILQHKCYLLIKELEKKNIELKINYYRLLLN